MHLLPHPDFLSPFLAPGRAGGSNTASDRTFQAWWAKAHHNLPRISHFLPLDESSSPTEENSFHILLHTRSEAIKLIGPSGRDYVLGWSPEGDGILVGQDGRGGWEAYPEVMTVRRSLNACEQRDLARACDELWALRSNGQPVALTNPFATDLPTSPVPSWLPALEPGRAIMKGHLHGGRLLAFLDSLADYAGIRISQEQVGVRTVCAYLYMSAPARDGKGGFSPTKPQVAIYAPRSDLPWPQSQGQLPFDHPLVAQAQERLEHYSEAFLPSSPEPNNSEKACWTFQRPKPRPPEVLKVDRDISSISAHKACIIAEHWINHSF